MSISKCFLLINTAFDGWFLNLVNTVVFCMCFGEHMNTFWWVILKTGIIGSKGLHIFNFSRYCQTDFQSGLPNYTLTSNVWEFWLLYILTSSWCYQPFNLSHSSGWGVILSLVIDEVEHLSKCLLGVWISPFCKYLNILPIF